MLTGGRIVVAAVGAIVLIVAAVLVVRSVWWDPTSKSTPFTPSSLSAGPSSPPPSGADSATPSTADSGGGDGGGTGGGDTGASPGGGGDTGGGGSTTATTSAGSGGGSSGGTTSSTSSYEATTAAFNKHVGSATANVTLPQVKGPDAAVVSAFNDGMNSVLFGQASNAGTLNDRPGSGVRIGKDVLSGLLATSFTNGGGNSTALAGTVVVNIQDHSVITVASLFDDESAGLKRLVVSSKQLGPQANPKFSGTNLQADEATFQRWTAESTGMKVYFAQGTVAPASEGVVDVTIPWSSLSDVMSPSIAKIVSS